MAIRDDYPVERTEKIYMWTILGLSEVIFRKKIMKDMGIQ